MFQLTLAAVKKAGLKALNEGRLSAQGPKPKCLYRDPEGNPCVVGAALPDEVAAQIKANSSNARPVSGLMSEGLIQVPDDEYSAIRRLQGIHDRWAQVKSGKTQPYAPTSLYSLRGLDADQLEARLREELSA